MTSVLFYISTILQKVYQAGKTTSREIGPVLPVLQDYQVLSV